MRCSKRYARLDAGCERVFLVEYPSGSGGGPAMSWDPRRSGGDEPDPRFTLANERTFLAWLRTGMAFMAAGLAAHELLDRQTERHRLLIALSLLLVGATIVAVSHRRWRSIELAMRHGRPLPYTQSLAVLTGASITIAALCGVLLVVC